MGKIAVLTDSNSGITQEQAKELGVYVIPMPFFIDGQQYFEGINLTQEEFYEKLKNDADISITNRYVFLEDEANGIKRKELYYENILDSKVFNSKKYEYYIFIRSCCCKL